MPAFSSPPSDLCDVLIIGGGPSGSTAAALLAERGVDVVLIEKDCHPRFHIGESLLPRSLPIFERLGVSEEISRIGVFKPGAQFVSDETGMSSEYDFATGLAHDYTHAFQVKRAEFDHALFMNAQRKGARAYEQTVVTEVNLVKANGRRSVTARSTEARTKLFAPKLIIDASGRDTFLSRRLGLKVVQKSGSTAAVYAHFRNVAFPGNKPPGHITIHLTRRGWFWVIPLPGGLTSVGFVGGQETFKDRRDNLEAFFFDLMRDSPTVSSRMKRAILASEVLGTADYSYCAKASCGEGYLMIGDAFAFLDPIFSTGVMFAMMSGESAAEIAMKWLEDAQVGLTMARRAERRARHSLKKYAWFIHRINHPVFRDMFMAPSNRLQMRAGVVSLLAGNMRSGWRDQLPLLAFKCMFYALSIGYAFGARVMPAATHRTSLR
ncbi:MAG TPA: NAD(P)/FAD-dependent oxidoreductase [Candidatus Binataceae bacterium]|nr:NAD(P)/FAD-dependent oxidoreductase [Candidatus Binataceae bacterium]